ncbi:MAG: DUF1156 domain-containing protein [Deltaproteobacteria bacterium]|nr:DUF1156 domain-containing protein [Deltaproteobacteria bacterium]
MTQKKKLIEVALPLDAINKASAREKSIRHGHPSTLHLWWARRPLAAARAVIFSQMVDDPSEYTDVLLSDPGKKRRAQHELKKRLALWESKGADGKQKGPKSTIEEVIADQERERLFNIIEDLVKWENTTNEAVLQKARDEIWTSWRRTCAENADHPRARELFDRYKLPAFHDPFAGGGSLPLEAQRLGLEAYASDLNPVAVVINKAMIEIPPKFAGKPPVNPDWQKKIREEKSLQIWKGAKGLAEDVRYYGKWMRDEAEKRIGHLYPKIEVTPETAKDRPDLKPYVGRKLTVIAWLWARTVKSPNPAFAHVDVPLASTFMLSTKPGKEAYVEPVIENGSYWFTVKAGKPNDADAAKAGTKLGRGANFRCVMSGTPIAGDYIKAEGKAGRMGARLMAIVAEGDRRRLYLAPTPEHEVAAKKAKPEWKPEGEVPARLTGGTCVPYGLSTWGKLFTPRQLVALTTFSDLVGEAMERVKRDALAAGLPDDGVPLRHLPAPSEARHPGGTGATTYAEAVSVYLGMTISRQANRSCTISFWDNMRENIQQAFGRQALPMTWDFCESNPFSASSGNWLGQLMFPAKSLEASPASIPGFVSQLDAQRQGVSTDRMVSTDPPYYDNIGYADLSDFFYVWLRRSLRHVFPELLATLAAPKAEELVAIPYRHGSKEKAETFFLDGMTQAMRCLAVQAHPAFPVTIYYAFKQAETKGNGDTTSTGWETFLDAAIRAGFGISGTWPIRTELTGNLKKNVSALASSIVLVCRPLSKDLTTATRREFITALKNELSRALAHLQRSNIAPVDLAQAAIGPGMAIFTRYEKVLDAKGNPMTVREALSLINQTLDEALAEQEGDFDADTRWALAWFEHAGFSEGEFGVAETLSKAKNTSVEGMVKTGILFSGRGKVRLLKPMELPENWDPADDKRFTVWEAVHQFIRSLETGGEKAAALLAAKLGTRVEIARDLAYRLYVICERKKRAKEALSYNALVQSFTEIGRLAQQMEIPKKPEQMALPGQE